MKLGHDEARGLSLVHAELVVLDDVGGAASISPALATGASGPAARATRGRAASHAVGRLDTVDAVGAGADCITTACHRRSRASLAATG